MRFVSAKSQGYQVIAEGRRQKAEGRRQKAEGRRHPPLPPFERGEAEGKILPGLSFRFLSCPRSWLQML
ncbi:MAG: hypothetical protein F6K18_10835 [Okeania sp. SIO2C2]|uniref:hypothetical protein n=1 Tax=Okeania sp. SIO2C2 TaxID=2607787 RepID=UPI0013BE83BC|nr:hypothetical protein [Okeania sp. SIO2C2]NEP87282.1 hypothetical protein [Okeania sp. SIO2C2]